MIPQGCPKMCGVLGKYSLWGPWVAPNSVPALCWQPSLALCKFTASRSSLPTVPERYSLGTSGLLVNLTCCIRGWDGRARLQPSSQCPAQRAGSSSWRVGKGQSLQVQGLLDWRTQDRGPSCPCLTLALVYWMPTSATHICRSALWDLSMLARIAPAHSFSLLFSG